MNGQNPAIITLQKFESRQRDRDSLDAYIDGVEHLPPTPELMVSLLGIFKQTDPNIDEVVRLINRDPSLTAEVLRLCNSAWCGGENPVSDMFEAVSRLGFYEVYRLVVMISGLRLISMPTATANLQLILLRKHSLATAVSAAVIATEVGESPAAAFTAGLLHDIGKVVLALAEGTRYSELAYDAEIHTSSIVGAEKQAFGFDHGEIGGRLLERWHLPTDLVAAIIHHHELEAAGEFARLAALVAFADVLAHGVLGHSATEASELANGAQAMAVLNLRPAAVRPLIERVRNGLERDAALMAAA